MNYRPEERSIVKFRRDLLACRNRWFRFFERTKTLRLELGNSKFVYLPRFSASGIGDEELGGISTEWFLLRRRLDALGGLVKTPKGLWLPPLIQNATEIVAATTRSRSISRLTRIGAIKQATKFGVSLLESQANYFLARPATYDFRVTAKINGVLLDSFRMNIPEWGICILRASARVPTVVRTTTHPSGVLNRSVLGWGAVRKIRRKDGATLIAVVSEDSDKGIFWNKDAEL